MSTKLTLTIDKTIIEKAKKYAKSQGRSLSNLIEEYLRSVTSKEKEVEEMDLSSEVRALLGSVKPMPGDKSYKDLLEEEVLKKHL